MPTITCYHRDLEILYTEKLSLQKLSEVLEKAKAEFKGYDEKTGEIKIEIVDTNRPDLWSAEGIARQLRESLLHKKSSYPFFSATPSGKDIIIVDKNMADIRPYIGGFFASNIEVDEFLLTGLIQIQEKLTENYGRSRELIAIGVHDASKIEFPLSYKGFSPKEISFSPLGFTEEMDLSEILERHPKGQEYGRLVKNFSLYPVLQDAANKVLSFPPVINSNDLGRVVVGNKALFVDITGTSLESVILCVNIMACNLSDRGAHIRPFMVEYPSSRHMTPQNLKQIVTLEQEYLEKILGEKVDPASIMEYLSFMGFSVSKEENKLICESPPYRRDCLHSVDLIEDFAISRGYNTFSPEMPEKYTVGSMSPIIEFADTLRMLMTGMGFQEFITYILTGKDKLFDKMNRPEGDVVEVANVMSDTYSVLRPTLLPVLLEIESKNLRVEFPHKIFEEGEVVIPAPKEILRSKTLHNLSAIVSHSGANFSEIHSYLHSLMFYLNIPYKLEETSDPAFIDGRAGKIISFNREVGIIGEIYPGVLENWGIMMPVAAFELTLDYNLVRSEKDF